MSSAQRRNHLRVILPTTVTALVDGDVFSVDYGRTWHVAYRAWGEVVTVYTSARRDEDAPTVRIPADQEATCLVLTCSPTTSDEDSRM